MNLLAFDTSTEVMSIGVSRTVNGVSQQWLHTGAGGAQASTGLIAGVMDLLQQAGLAPHDLQAIYLTGGSSALRPLRQALRAAFPDTPQVEGDLFGGVAAGLAVAAP